MRSHFLLLLILCLLILLNPLRLPVSAQTMRSDSYEVHMGNFNMTAGKKSSENYQVTDTVGQTASGLYKSEGYQVGAGFWYLKRKVPFTFTISEINLNFGLLTPQVPKVLTNTLTVSAGGAGGYQVSAFENHPLMSAAENYIPDTLGDNGNASEITAAPWTQNTTYGFGFRMSGDDIPNDFNNPACSPNCFRQFADPTASPPEEPQIVMSSVDLARHAEATASYKINISGDQPAGVYQNQIIFIAIPLY